MVIWSLLGHQWRPRGEPGLLHPQGGNLTTTLPSWLGGVRCSSKELRLSLSPSSNRAIPFPPVMSIEAKWGAVMRNSYAPQPGGISGDWNTQPCPPRTGRFPTQLSVEAEWGPVF